MGRGIGGISNGCVGERFFLEASTGIADPEDHRPGGANGMHFDDLFGIELRSVFHGVHQNLSKCLDNLLSGVFGQLGAELLCKGKKALGWDEAASGTDGDTSGPSRKAFDVVPRLIVGGGTGGEGSDLMRIEGMGDTAEDPGSQRGDDLVGGAALRKD